MSEQQYEQVRCPTCSGLRGGCTTCNNAGVILRPVGAGSLDPLRSKLDERYGPDPFNPRTGPRHDDPLWVGHEPQ